MRRATPWLLGALLALLLTSGAVAEEDRRTLTLLVTSGTAGRLVAEDGSTPATVAALVRQVAERAGPDVVVLDAGRTIAPYAESVPDRGRAVMAALAAAGCTAWAPDPVDFAAGLEPLAAVAGEVLFPVLRPFEDDRGTALASGARVDLGDGLVVGMTSLFDPAFAPALEAAGIREARLTVPGDGNPEPGRFEVAVVHSRGTGRSLADRSWLWRLLEQPGPSRLLLDPDLDHDVVVRRDGTGGPVFLVGRVLPPAGSWRVLRVEVELEREGGRWRPSAVHAEAFDPPPRLEPDSGLRDLMVAAFESFRRQRGAELPLTAPRDHEGLERFALAALREAARAEIAVLNRGALRPVDRSLLGDGPATEEVVVRMLSLDQRVVSIELSGAELRALALDSARRPRRADGGAPRDSLVFLGLEQTVTGVGTPAAKVANLRVNGRAVRDDDRYRVALGSFLAAGGDGYALLAEAVADTSRRPGTAAPELRDDVVLPRLREAGRPFIDLARRPVWRWGVDRLGLAASGVTTDRPDGYEAVSDSRARADDSFSLLFDARLRADRELPSWRWENRLGARLGLLDVADAERRETDDDLRFDSSAVWSGSGLPFGAEPYAGLIVDSELRRNRDRAGREAPRQLESSLSAGLSWSWPTVPRLRFGVVARDYGPLDRPWRVGLIAEGQLLVKPRERRLGLDLRVLLEALGEGGTTVRRADLDARLLVPVRGGLVLTPGLNWYLYDESEIPGRVGYLQISVGLGYSWTTRTPRLD